MKRFVVILMIISLMVLGGSSIFAGGTSQINATLVNQAGKQLQSFASQYYTGFWLEVGGFVSTLMRAYVSPTLASVGTIVTLAGSIIQLLAVNNINEAGASLRAATTPNQW
jgi:hypothetical protein